MLEDLPTSVTIGTRASKLAMWQTRHIAGLLSEAWPGLRPEIQIITTRGDRTLDEPLAEIGGKGLFTAELEEALDVGAIDLAVHSLKDLPVDDAPGLVLGAIVGRADVRDVLIAPDGLSLEQLPAGAVVGTSSLRRQAQLLAARPDLQTRSIRGNVETRIRKVEEGQYDATILALAGVSRLGLETHISQVLPLELMLPAPGQGALGVQCRAADDRTRKLLAGIDGPTTRSCVTAERVFLQALGGGCATPVAAHATIVSSGLITLSGLVASIDGRRVIRLEVSGRDPLILGRAAAEEALRQAAGDILKDYATPT